MTLYVGIGGYVLLVAIFLWGWYRMHQLPGMKSPRKRQTGDYIIYDGRE
jgi:hypothetical protein